MDMMVDWIPPVVTDTALACDDSTRVADGFPFGGSVSTLEANLLGVAPNTDFSFFNTRLAPDDKPAGYICLNVFR